MPSLLYLLNVSNPDRLSADSGWIYATLVLPALAKGMDVTIACPKARPLHDRVQSLPLTTPPTKYRARFSLDMEETSRLILQTRPDTVWVNQIENAPGVRACLAETGIDAQIVGYCHYVPFHVDQVLHLDPSLNDAGLGLPVVLQFFAGLLACDRVLVHSWTSHDWLTWAADRLDLPIADRLRIVPPPLDPRLVLDTDQTPPPTANAIYNHRLYRHYGTPRFIDLARQLTTQTDVTISVLDLFGTRSAGRVSLDSSPELFRDQLTQIHGVNVVSDQGDRAIYRQHLANARFGIAPFRPGTIWSMSVIDCHTMGLPVIAPRMAWFTEEIDPDLQFDTTDEAIALASRLTSDADFWQHHSRMVRARSARLTPDATARKLLEVI